MRSNDAVDTFQKSSSVVKSESRLRAHKRRRCVGSGDSNRNADRVVLYEDMRKAKLNDFLAALESVRAVRDVAEEIASNTRALEKIKFAQSVSYRETNADDDDYCGDLFFPKDAISKGLRDFETAFDWVKAKECGRIEPTAGVDAAVDARTMPSDKRTQT